MHLSLRWGRTAGAAGRVPVLLPLALVVVCGGCPFARTPGSSTDDGTASGTDRNANLANATPLKLSAGDAYLEFTGTISGRSDVDVYDLGTLAIGDRVTIDIERTSGNLDAVAGVFDSRTYLVAFNDDRAADGTNLDPQIDFYIHGGTGKYYLAIIAYAGNNTTGNYAVTLDIQRDAGLPPDTVQLVYLNWAGGQEVRIRNVGLYNLTPFSATDVRLAVDQTEALKDRVQTIVAERYDGYNLIVLNSDDHPVPSVPYSSVYFGGRDYEAFAISQQIDSYNADPEDDAIIFTQSFGEVFGGQANLEQMAQALGNTVAHEVGHLLGLVHTADCDDLMDTTCYNDRLLREQEFKAAVLDDSVFPFGYQDSAELLGWILGLVGS